MRRRSPPLKFDRPRLFNWNLALCVVLILLLTFILFGELVHDFNGVWVHLRLWPLDFRREHIQP